MAPNASESPPILSSKVLSLAIVSGAYKGKSHSSSSNSPSKIWNSNVLFIYSCLRGTPKLNSLKQQLTFSHDSWVCSVQQVVLLLHVASAGVTHATVLSWEFGWLGDFPNGLIHVLGSWLAVGWAASVVLPSASLSSRIAQTSHPAVLFKGAELEAARPLKARLRCHMATISLPSIGPSKSQGHFSFKEREHGLTLSSFCRGEQHAHPGMRGIAGGQFCRQSARCHHSPCISSPPGCLGHNASKVPDSSRVLSSKPSLYLWTHSGLGTSLSGLSYNFLQQGKGVVWAAQTIEGFRRISGEMGSSQSRF